MEDWFLILSLEWKYNKNCDNFQVFMTILCYQAVFYTPIISEENTWMQRNEVWNLFVPLVLGNKDLIVSRVEKNKK